MIQELFESLKIFVLFYLLMEVTGENIDTYAHFPGILLTAVYATLHTPTSISFQSTNMMACISKSPNILTNRLVL